MNVRPARRKRRNLANNRAGEYEGLPKKLKDPAWKPDFGPAEWSESVQRSGAVAVGVRKLLVAYNVNLQHRRAPVRANASPSTSARLGA
jgi:glutamate formiminotransferase/formiminotetrahydrofolate cyclodeaminase